jgi:hypothetical protein
MNTNNNPINTAPASTITIAELAQDVLQGWEMNWDGQDVYGKARTGAAMVKGEQMQAEGDRIAGDAELRAEAAGIDILDVLYCAKHLLEAKRRHH